MICEITSTVRFVCFCVISDDGRRVAPNVLSDEFHERSCRLLKRTVKRYTVLTFKKQKLYLPNDWLVLARMVEITLNPVLLEGPVVGSF